MRLKPFGLDCRACGNQRGNGIELRYCERDHGDDRSGQNDLTTYRSSLMPHIHATCRRCNFMWLEQTVSNIDDDEQPPRTNQPRAISIPDDTLLGHIAIESLPCGCIRHVDGVSATIMTCARHRRVDFSTPEPERI